MERAKQQFDFGKKVLSYQVGSGKDAKIFIKFKAEVNGKKEVYNIPLLTLNSIQLFLSQAKVPRHCFGSPDPKGLSLGTKNYKGFLTASTLNESIGKILRKKLKYYKPLKAENLTLNTDGIIDIVELENLQYLDQLPTCEITIFLTNPINKKVFSKTIEGIAFNAETHNIGEVMGEQISFSALRFTPLKLEEISQVRDNDEIQQNEEEATQ